MLFIELSYTFFSAPCLYLVKEQQNILAEEVHLLINFRHIYLGAVVSRGRGNNRILF